MIQARIETLRKMGAEEFRVVWQAAGGGYSRRHDEEVAHA